MRRSRSRCLTDPMKAPLHLIMLNRFAGGEIQRGAFCAFHFLAVFLHAPADAIIALAREELASIIAFWDEDAGIKISPSLSFASGILARSQDFFAFTDFRNASFSFFAFIIFTAAFFRCRCAFWLIFRHTLAATFIRYHIRYGTLWALGLFSEWFARFLGAFHGLATAFVRFDINCIASRTVGLLVNGAYLFHAFRFGTSAVPGELLFLDFARTAFDVGVIFRTLAAAVRLAKTAVALVLDVARILVFRTAIEHFDLDWTLFNDARVAAFVDNNNRFSVNQLLLGFMATVRLLWLYRQTFVGFAAGLRVFNHLACFAFSASFLASGDRGTLGQGAATFVAFFYNLSFLANLIAFDLRAFFRFAFSFNKIQNLLATNKLFVQCFWEHFFFFLDRRYRFLKTRLLWCRAFLSRYAIYHFFGGFFARALLVTF